MTNANDISETEAQAEDLRWYIVHTYSGQEDLVEKNLNLRINSLDMEDRIKQVLVPTEEEVVFKDGKRRSERKKLFPGYILVRMAMDDESWYAVRKHPRGNWIRVHRGRAGQPPQAGAAGRQADRGHSATG